MSDSNATKNALAASMKKLMAKKPFEKISVSDICNDCGINRKSFYYHFRDKYDLVNWIFYVGFIEGLDMSSYESGWDCLSDVMHYFYSEKKFYRAALKIEGQNSFKDYLVETTTPVIRFFLQDILPSDDEDDFYLTFISDALLQSLVRWLSGGYEKEMDADQYVAKLHDVIVRISQILPQEGKEITSEEKKEGSDYVQQVNAKNKPGK